MVKFFLKKSVVTICLNLSILLIGYFSIGPIANEFLPTVSVPAVAVVFPITVLHHDDVVHDLIAPIEKGFLQTGEVEKIEVSLDQDRVILLVHYDWGISPDECLLRARQLVSSYKRPLGVLNPLFILHRPTLNPILRVAISGLSIGELTDKTRVLSETIERFPGVSEVRRVGSSPEVGFVDFSSKEMAQNRLNIVDVLNSATLNWSFRSLFKGKDSSVIIKHELNEVDDLNEMLITHFQDSPIPLKWISQVRKGVHPASVFIGAGQDALVFEVLKSPGSDTVEIIRQSLDELSQLFKSESKLKSTIIYNEADKIKEAQKGVFQNFAIGVLLNSIVLIIFLGSIIGAVVASCVFPTAILGTFFIMKNFDVSINIFALNGFSLASGMITDASIVVLESILRRFQLGEDLIDSCWKGTKDVMMGVIASGITTAAVILPIGFQTGIASKLFSDLGLTLVSTQFICLITVFSLVPWICSKILSRNSKPLPPIAFAYGGSQYFVKMVSLMAQKALLKSNQSRSFKYSVLVGVTLMSLLSLFMLPESEFLPTVSSSIYSLSVPVKRIQLLSQKDHLKSEISNLLGHDPNISWVVTFSTDDTLEAMFEVKLKDKVDSIIEIVSQKLKFPAQKIVISPLGPTPNTEPLGSSGYFYISDSIGTEKVNLIIEEFCSSRGIIDCTTDYQYKEAKLVFKSFPLTMARANTNVFETTINLASFTQSLDLSSLANLPYLYPIYLNYSKDEDISNFPFFLGKDRKALSRFGSLFEEKKEFGQNIQFRRNGNVFSPLYFRIDGITIGQAVDKMSELTSKFNLSQSDVVGMGGIETMNETFDKMIVALIISGILILLILIIQFQSVIQALIIMYSIPLSLGGAIIGLILLNETVNAGVIVGFILLIGIIVNNGILLMDAINQRLSNGMDCLEAILDSVQTRTRPILMTTCSTVLGMMPTLLFEAEGKELYQGMAIVNIFGMTFGTLLTLIVTPILINFLLGRKLKEI